MLPAWMDVTNKQRRYIARKDDDKALFGSIGRQSLQNSGFSAHVETFQCYLIFKSGVRPQMVFLFNIRTRFKK